MPPNKDIEPFERELLWCAALGISRSTLRAHPEYIHDEATKFKVGSWIERRKKGEPIAYILGEKEFWSLPLKVNPHVLIPRPETELLVQTVLEKFSSVSHKCILDLGTGSGAIALALAHERPDWCIVATDQSSDALDVARANAENLNIKNVDFYEGNWYLALPNLERKISFDVIVSNPPYIAWNDAHLKEGDCRFEPIEALQSGLEGLDDLRLIISNAVNYLTPKGWLLVEHGYDQGPRVFKLFQEHGFENIAQLKDLALHERVVVGQICI